MSTAGKVLTVLILLSMAGWMVLASAVTQLNKNYGARVAKNQQELETLTKQAEDTARSALALVEKAHQEQSDMVRDLREIQTRIVAAERHQSATNASLARLKFQVSNYEASLEAAKQALAVRESEEAQANETKANLLAAIEKAKALNADLRDRLGKLQEEFKQILTKNTQALGSGPGASAEGRTTRTARAL